MAGLFFEGGTASSSNQLATPTPTLSPFDRLAKPTLPAEPSQADLGAQDYWLYCLPCHGDRGQGLTEEFRETYPPGEVDCWQSGCHGKRPYENGFTLPTAIPAVIGPGAIGKFTDAAQLHAYIRAAMPYWKPGSLTEDEYWRVTAFLLRDNGLWDDSQELNPSNAGGVRIAPGTPTPLVTPEQVPVREGGGMSPWLLIPIVLIILLVLFFFLKKIQNKATI
ncbi:MAG: hypothetical protein C3F07_19285 [Anaerolineales bacterium]|nr:hypothetical protein [Anaerolineae bacterium]PWB69387.1 MAG: hypothetical protein C3F07_19285 [Anaerolineales bacterium]